MILKATIGRSPVTADQRQVELDRRWQRIDNKLKRQHERKRSTKPSLATLRVSELNRLFCFRYKGTVLPDDDDGRENLEIMADHLAELTDNRSRIRNWTKLWTPWLTDVELVYLADKVISRPRRWKADRLAQKLNLTIADRDQLKIRTIGAVDLDKTGRERRRREKDRQTKEANRRAAGAKPRAQSASRTKPWIGEGVSRSKWYADRRAARSAETA